MAAARARIDAARAGRLHILEVQRLIRTMPKVVIAAVPGWAAGGGHSLNVVCDLSLASIEHARFKQTDANVGSFDAGYGSTLLARQIGDKRAREIFFLARTYDAVTAERWGVVNEAVPHAELEERALEYAAIVADKSPQAIRMLKLAFKPGRRRPGGPAGLRGRGHASGPHDRRGRRGAQRLPPAPRPRLVAVPLLLLSAAGSVRRGAAALRTRAGPAGHGEPPGVSGRLPGKLGC